MFEDTATEVVSGTGRAVARVFHSVPSHTLIVLAII
jgi:hypothetical protein